MPIDALRRQIEVNVVGLLATTQAFLPLIREGSRGMPGRIVNMGSISGRFAGPFVGPYAASKHAVEALSDSLRVELRPWAIHVSVIEPGRIATPIWEKSLVESEALAVHADPQQLARYKTALDRMRAFVGRFNARRLPPERVAEAVEHALFAPRPKTRYVIGLDAWGQLLLAKFVPDRWRDALVVRALGLAG
jgi:NAD(P)-dependent dehydrogenase (short-subunit alcohol dehydrogenase family)